MINLEKIREIQNRLKSQGSNEDVDYFKPKSIEGQTTNNIIRILPPFPGKDLPFKELGFHYISEGRTFMCPQVLDNQPCPICEVVEKLMKSPVKDDKKLAADWRVQVKGAFNILDRSDNKVKVWTTSPKIYKIIVDYLAEWESLYGDSPLFTDPDEGRDFNLKYTAPSKSGELPKYELMMLDKKPLSSDKNRAKEILEEILDLDEVFKSLGYDELKERFGDFDDPEVSKESGAVDKPEKQEKLSQERPPKCFGKEYDDGDDECTSCKWVDDCITEMRGTKKKEKEKKSEEETVEESVEDILAKARKQRRKH